MINPYWELVILLCMIHVMLAVSLNLILGYNGQFSLGHAGFIAIGAYTSGVLTSAYGVPLWAAFLVAILLAAFAALLIGYPCLRLRGDYLAIATLGFAEIIRIVLLALPQQIFGGPTGMGNVPSFKDYINLPAGWNAAGNLVGTILLSLLFIALMAWAAWAFSNAIERFTNRLLKRTTHARWAVLALLLMAVLACAKPLAAGLLGVFQFNECGTAASIRSEQWALFLLFALILLAVTWMTRNYLGSLTGRNVIAIREDEIAAANLGIDCTWLKLQNFMLGCAMAGLGGAMLAHTLSLFKPLDFNFFKSVDVLLMVVLGGMGSITGSYVGAVAITLLPELLRFLGRWRMVIYSLALIALMLFKPEGMLGNRELGEMLRLKLGLPARRGAGGPPAVTGGRDA